MADMDSRPFDTDGSFQQLLIDYGSVVEGVEQRQAQNAPQAAEGQAASPVPAVVRGAVSRASGNDGADGGGSEVVDRYYIKRGVFRRREQVTKEVYDAWIKETRRREEESNNPCNCC